MVGIGSFSLSPPADAATNSDMRFLRDGGRYVSGRDDRLSSHGGRLSRGGGDRVIGEGRQGRRRFGRTSLARRGPERTASDPLRRRAGRENRLPVLNVQVRNLLLDLRLELV